MSTSAMRWLCVRGGGLLLLGAAVMGCGSDGGGKNDATATTSVGATKSSASLTDFEQQVAAELAVPEVSMTEAEVECLAVVLADGADSVQEAIDKTAPYDSLHESLVDLAPDCFDAERLKEIQAKYDSYETKTMGEAEKNLAKMWIKVFIGGGASTEEAECLADVQAADAEGSIPLYGSYEPDSPELTPFADCAGGARLAEIFSEAYAAPLREQLVAAGATKKEARCLVAEVDQIDLWFPSGSFEGDGAANMAADAFTDDGSACGKDARLREIAVSLHSD